MSDYDDLADEYDRLGGLPYDDLFDVDGNLVEPVLVDVPTPE